MAIDKERAILLYPLMIKRDKRVVEEIYNEYSRAVYGYAQKYIGTIFIASRGMYDLEDIVQELWKVIINELPKYNYNKSSFTTWLFMICKTHANMLHRRLSMKKRVAEGGMVSLNNTMKDDTNKEEEMINFLVDSESIPEKIVTNNNNISLYLFILKALVDNLSEIQKMVYLHMILGMTQAESGKELSLSQSYVCRIRNKIIAKLSAYKSSNNLSLINQREADKISNCILNKRRNKNVLEELNIDSKTVMICRAALEVANIC